MVRFSVLLIIGWCGQQVQKLSITVCGLSFIFWREMITNTRRNLLSLIFLATVIVIAIVRLYITTPSEHLRNALKPAPEPAQTVPDSAREQVIPVVSVVPTVKRNPHRNILNSTVYIVGALKGSGVWEGQLHDVYLNVLELAAYWQDYVIVLYADELGTQYAQKWNDAKVVILKQDFHHFYRTYRIAHARNALLHKVQDLAKSIMQPLRDSYMIAVDMDGVNEKPYQWDVLHSVMSHRTEWDALTFNREDYYDIWALRYRRFDVNCFGVPADIGGLINIMKADIVRELSRSASSFYPVFSAFNGLGIYRLSETIGCEYDGKNYELPGVDELLSQSKEGENKPGVDLVEDCEHVAFHKCLISKHNAKVAISKHILSL
jgi:hypothetical protein